jgi:uncharacterized protein
MKNALNGKELNEMFTAATVWLEKLVPDINALNVYPVPDGDCGTNMLFTMKASLAEADKADKTTVSSVASAMAKGALMGARGNSGVILSQIWRGIAKSMNTKISINGKGWADALSEASKTAYNALSNPVEGTILTVIRDSAAAAQKSAADNGTLVTVLENAVVAARDSVAGTPSLLPVLKEAGVVDAGGHELYTLLEGALHYIREETDGRKPELIGGLLAIEVKPAIAPAEEEAYGFCTQFLIRNHELDIEGLRSRLQNMGKSLIVVGDQTTVRVHIHTLDPESVKIQASSYGTLSDIDIRNMDEQHKDFLLMHRDRAFKLDTSIIAVVNGDGLANIFSDLGVAAIIPGGQTMNPSTMDIFQAVEAVSSKNVIILPNNKNIIPTANQVKYLTKKNITIIPTESIPQGVTALVAFSPEADYKTNMIQMNEAVGTVRTIEITHSTRTAKFDGIEVKEGQAIGLLDGKLQAAADKEEDVIFSILKELDTSNANIITVYYGKDINAENAEGIERRIRREYPKLELEVLRGGQPYYSYIISLE